MVFDHSTSTDKLLVGVVYTVEFHLHLMEVIKIKVVGCY